jgi:hypothetical protein
MNNITIYLKSGQSIAVTGDVRAIQEADRPTAASDRYQFHLDHGQRLHLDQLEIVAVLSVDEWS